ncbi:hypothetical protein BV898_17122 [Hypsibius exemplaris]|uniref:Centrosomal protein of 44 kDa n=1 Tax=Hypsibius exemplaris TaxID=2072580 RepID=A0A9X6NLR4_HYPEX|nr:hypothetical protein BV898_17122 [Hypsibius exemplaris]
MSRSGSCDDDCPDYHHRVQSTNLLRLFEQLQSIGFPIAVLEANLERLKLGSANIGFYIYMHVYREFRRLFLQVSRPLDQFILNDRVIDRESFATEFFAALRDIIDHEQTLPLYQYICPGHPLSKNEEIASITLKLRQRWKERRKDATVNTVTTIRTTDQPYTAGMVDRSTGDRRGGRSLRQSASSTRAVYGSIGGSNQRTNQHAFSSSSKSMHPARVGPPGDIPWQAVRETQTGMLLSGADDSGGLDSSDGEDVAVEGEASPDEGIKSWNASSAMKTPVDLPDPDPIKAWLKEPFTVARDFAMDKDEGVQAILNRFEKLEIHHNSRFRSIEDHLIRLEHNLVSNNLALHRTMTERLDNHEVRINGLESGKRAPSATAVHRTQSRSSTRNRSLTDQKNDDEKSTSDRSAVEVDESATLSRKKISVDIYNNSEPRRRGSTMQSLRSASVASRPLTAYLNGNGEENALNDSGFSSTQPAAALNNSREGPEVVKSDHRKASQLGSANFSSYFESRSKQTVEEILTKAQRMEEEDRRERSSRKGSGTLRERHASRSQSVAPPQLNDLTMGRSALGEMKVASGKAGCDDTALLDLNERIQLRLKERIKTAEETLNACMETIRKDYVLIRRPN